MVPAQRAAWRGSNGANLGEQNITTQVKKETEVIEWSDSHEREATTIEDGIVRLYKALVNSELPARLMMTDALVCMGHHGHWGHHADVDITRKLYWQSASWTRRESLPHDLNMLMVLRKY